MENKKRLSQKQREINRDLREKTVGKTIDQNDG